ncbi:MAG TPA: hypothetical protein VHZ49_09185 [Methylomirabilota bacterium]|nr:hypothetical protein [Methylomirabilota bacterium]
MRAMTVSRRQLLLILTALCAVAPLLVLGATLAHTHDRGTPGLYNQEHDFTLYAVSVAAALPEAATALVAIVVAASLCVVLPQRPHRLVGAAADSRAPPAR